MEKIQPGPHHDISSVRNAGHLLEETPKNLSRLALSSNECEAAIGMASINSLLEVDENCSEMRNTGELLMTEGEGKKVAIIGHFPFVSRLRPLDREPFILEKNP